METAPSQTTMFTAEDGHAEDAELISQLAKLQNMHHRIHHLRTLLPTALMGPARAAISQQSRTNPQAVAEAVAKAARQGSADIRDFQKDWHDEKTRQLFKDANAADTPQGIDAWLVDYETLARSGTTTAAPTTDAKDEAFDTDDEARADLEKQINDKTIPLELDEGSEIGKFPVTVVLPGGKKFTINNDEAPRTYTIQAASDGTLTQQISNQLSKSGRADSGVWKKIGELVQVLKQYHDVGTRRCVICKSLVDDNFNYPLVRKAEFRKEGDGGPILKWDAYHSTCLKKRSTT